MSQALPQFGLIHLDGGCEFNVVIFFFAHTLCISLIMACTPHFVVPRIKILKCYMGLCNDGRYQVPAIKNEGMICPRLTSMCLYLVILLILLNRGARQDLLNDLFKTSGLQFLNKLLIHLYLSP